MAVEIRETQAQGPQKCAFGGSYELNFTQMRDIVGTIPSGCHEDTLDFAVVIGSRSLFITAADVGRGLWYLDQWIGRSKYITAS